MLIKKTIFIGIALTFLCYNFNLQAQATESTAYAETTSIMESEEAEEAEEEEGAPITLSGSVDTYFRTNLSGGTNNTEDGGTLAPATSFANLPGFSLGMANLIASYEGGKVGAVADLVFGPRGSDAVFDSPRYSSSAQIINQLYAYLNVTDKLTLTMGNFNTFLGYEVISPTANFNYSTSYMFSYGPFSHTGLKIDYAADNGLSLMGAILNPTDITEFNPTGDYFFGGQVGYGGFYLNTLLGEDYTQFDLTGGIDVSDTFYLGVNATYTDAGENDNEDTAGFYGAALYAQLATSENFKLGLRYEFFNDSDGNYVFGTGINDTSASDITLTAQYSVGNLLIIPELRYDTASEDIFVNADGEIGNGLTSFVVAMVYGFA